MAGIQPPFPWEGTAMKRCFIFAAGTFCGLRERPGDPGDLVIAADAGFRICRKISVQNGIADPVSNFIGMAFGNRLRSKQKIAVFTHDGAVCPTHCEKGNRSPP